MTKTFTIALLACAIAGTSAVSAQQSDQSKEKPGTFSQPADPQPVVMPSGQRPDEWKFQKEKEAEANKAVDDKKAAKKKAEEDKKAAAEAKKKNEAERKLAAKAAREEAEKKRVEERRAAADKKKADEAQRTADARAEREAAAAKRAEEQKSADEQRALERRAAAEKAAEDRKAEAEKAAEEVREKQAREDEKKSAARKSAEQKAAEKSAEKAPSRNGSAPPVAAASDPAPASPPAPASNATQKPAGAQAAAGQKPADGAKQPAGAKQADGAKPAVDPVRPPAVIRSGETPDAWKMSSEKPRAEGAEATGQGQKGRSSDSKSSDSRSASTTTGQTKPAASAPPKPKEPWRGWSDRALISLNAGWQTASFDQRDTRNFDPPIPGDREQRTLAADYSVKSGVSLDLGGGLRVWRALAAGVSVTRFEDSRDVPISGSVPHPFFFNRARSVTGVVTGAREEMAVHVDAMWVMPIRQKMTLAIFGGPSFYGVKQTVVNDFDYNQSYPYDDVTLTRVVTEDESSSVTGVNFGADVGYYFTDMIGVGGVIRFGRASVDTSIGSIDVGGPEFGIGLRIRIPQGRPRTRAVTPQPPPTKR